MVVVLVVYGYIVVGVNYLGNIVLELFMYEGFMLWWECVIDVGEVLDGVFVDFVLGVYVDCMCIGVVGFLLGGYIVLELVGVCMDVVVFMVFCSLLKGDVICYLLEMVCVQINLVVDIMRLLQMEVFFVCFGVFYCDVCIKVVFVMVFVLGMVMDVMLFVNISIFVLLMVGDVDVIVFVDINV